MTLVVIGIVIMVLTWMLRHRAGAEGHGCLYVAADLFGALLLGIGLMLAVLP